MTTLTSAPDAPVPAEPTSAAPTATAAASAAPLSERTALLVLGTMLFLIVALTILLVESTWADTRVAVHAPPAADTASIAQR